MKKVFVVALAAVLLLSFCACGSKAPSAAENTPAGADVSASTEGSGAGAENVELRVAWWGGQSRNDKFNKMFDEYEKEFPNVKIIREFNNEAQFVEKVTTESAGGNAPDVFQASSFYLDDFIERNMYRAIDDLVTSGDISLSNFEKVDVDAGQKNGKQYLVLWGHILTGIIYNTDRMEKMGVALPQDDWTWDQYVRTLKDIQKNLENGTWATEDEGGLYRVFECYAQMKGKSLFKDNALGVDKTDLTEWFNMWTELRKAGVVPPASIQNEQGGKTLEQSMLARDKVMMMSTSSNQLVTFQGISKDELNIVSYPWINGAVKQTPLIASGVGISSNCKRVKEAAQLINWLVNSEKAQAVFLAEHGQPTSKKMQEFFKPLANEAQLKEDAYFKAMQPEIVPYPQQPAGSNSVKTLLTSENEAIAFGTKTVEEAVNDFIAQAGQILQR
jgi:multiple sugar transport system substrate-binding protein